MANLTLVLYFCLIVAAWSFYPSLPSCHTKKSPSYVACNPCFRNFATSSKKIVLRAGLGDWIRKSLEENVGIIEAGRPKEPEKEMATIKPDFNFKFSPKTKIRLEANVIDGNEVINVPQSVQKGDEPSMDTRFFEITLDRPTGIEFATDLSLKSLIARTVAQNTMFFLTVANRFVYIMEIKENSAAALAPFPPQVGDQLISINNADCIGLPFAQVADLLGKQPNQPLSLRFFRGSKGELLEAVGREADAVPQTACLSALLPDGSQVATSVPAGANLRDSLIKANVQVYNALQGRFSNCNGKQLCGTCIVDVVEGGQNTNSKSVDEANFLRRMPESYRLSCCVHVYGDVTLRTRPPTKKIFIEFA